MKRVKRIPLWAALLVWAVPQLLFAQTAGMFENSSEKHEIAVKRANTGSVALLLQERAGVHRNDEFVSFGVPLPVNWGLTDASQLKLTAETGESIPAQFYTLDRWGGDRSDPSLPVKWVLIGFKGTFPAYAVKKVLLKNDGPGPAPPVAIELDESVPGRLAVDTGAAQFELKTEGEFNLFNQVSINGKKVLRSLPQSGAILYAPAGDKGIVPGGTPNPLGRVTSVEVEKKGALSTVVKAVGSIYNGASQPVLDYTARLFFVAGSAGVRVDFTVENNHPVVEGEWGQPLNVHELGAVNSVYVGALKIGVELDNAEESVRILSEEEVDITSPETMVRLYQDSSGTEYWDVYAGMVGWEGASAEPRLQSFCSLDGFELTGPGILKQGGKALGWMAAGGQGRAGVMVAVKDFAENFPKAIEAGAGGKIVVDLFPNGATFGHNLRVGEEKTHSVLFYFTEEPLTGQAEQLARAFNDPITGTAPGSWYRETGVLGDVPEKDLSQWPLYERYVDVAFSPNPALTAADDPCCGNTTLLEAIDRYNLYGWQDYGDVPLDYEGFGDNQAGQMNLKYWYLNGMLQQFCRSQDPRWLDLALPAARHLSDIDLLHIPDSGIEHWVHGSYFGHSAHDEPGNVNPNRNFNSPSTDLLFGIPGLIFAFHLTGEQRFLDVAKEGLEGMANLHTQFMNSAYPVFYRERANLIFAYMEGYRQTGETRWLTLMQEIVRNTADLSNKGWLEDPVNYLPPEGGPEGESERISGFQFAQVLWTLGRYLDFAEEYALPDDLGVKEALSAYGDFIIDHLMKEIPAYLRDAEPGSYTEEILSRYEGHFATIDSIWFTAPYETYLEVNNWALLMADVLTYAYKYSGGQRFLTAASRLYETGTTDTVWLDDPPVYIASKDLVNSLNWGLVYMNTTGQVPGSDDDVPVAPLLSVTREGGILTLSWNPVAGAKGYMFYYVPVDESMDPGMVGSIPMENRTAISAAIWDAPAYYVAVQAYNDAGSSGYSNVGQVP